MVHAAARGDPGRRAVVTGQPVAGVMIGSPTEGERDVLRASSMQFAAMIRPKVALGALPGLLLARLIF
jgi:hypothetical protein